ncbi:MAG: TRL domain-containing protein [bacterium]
MAISPYLAVALVLFISDRAAKNLYVMPLEGPRLDSLYIGMRRPFSPPGLLYKKVVEPYSTDFNKTPVGSKSAILDRHMITQVGGDYNLSAEWDKNNINDITRQTGIEKIYYTDRETLSILLGLYRRKRTIIYGD